MFHIIKSQSIYLLIAWSTNSEVRFRADSTQGDSACNLPHNKIRLTTICLYRGSCKCAWQVVCMIELTHSLLLQFHYFHRPVLVPSHFVSLRSWAPYQRVNCVRFGTRMEHPLVNSWSLIENVLSIIVACRLQWTTLVCCVALMRKESRVWFLCSKFNWSDWAQTDDLF